LIVLDASAAVALLLNADGGPVVSARIAEPAESLHAPHLLAVEVAQVMRRYVATGAVAAEVAESALADLTMLDIAHYEHEHLLPRVWELRANLTAYDAVYVALSEVLDAPLLTFDRRLAAAPGHYADIELLPSG
jgi:predicted nucleic acid-binding protein